MAEVFVPSTTGEGQGAAQIFQSNPQFADASGIVRGIERGEARIAANQEKEYERQKAESAERRKKINELQELQYGGGSEFLRSVSDSIMDDFRKAVIDNGEDIDEAFSKARVGFERVKNADTGITKVAGLVNENVDNYRAFVDGKWTTGTLYEIEKAKSKHEGDWEEELTKYENELANFGNNNANMVDAGVSLERTYLQDKKAAEADEITKQTLLDNGDIEISKTIIPKNKQERRDLLLNNPQIQRSVLNEVKLQYGVSTQEEVEKAIGMPFPQYLKQKVDKLIEEEDRVIVKTQPQKKRGGLNFNFNNGRGENERFYFDFQKDLNEPLEKDSGSFTPRTKIRVESKSSNPTQDFTDNGDVFRGSLTAINLGADGKPENIMVGGNEMPYEENKFILEKEYGLTEDVINKLYNNSQKEKRIEKDAIYYILDGNRLTLDVLESAYGGIVPEGAEKVTEENKDMMEANLPDRTTRETLNEREAERRGNTEESSNTEEDNNKPEPRKPTLTDAEVKAMYGKKVSREVFKKMTVKQRAKFAQNAGTWE